MRGLSGPRVPGPLFFRASQPAYTLVDARLSWDSPDEAWSVAVLGTNLTDRVFLYGTLDFFESLGQNEGQYGRPREWGLSVKRRF
ncbi:MAG: hypothetical protein DIU71_02615 [Proteobacteria bacterium]|nr:MAG: hypothetical protein DIU71_02615 [Pseudomonadota bacterium]